MSRTHAGFWYGITAYFIWGSFPFFFGLIVLVSPIEVVPWRVAATLAFCAIVTTVAGKWRAVIAVLKDRKLLPWLVLSSLLLYTNWQIFVIGVMTGHVIETALGYFINPLFTILIGVFVRKESLRRLQWIAITIATVGVLVVTFGYGQVPWIGLSLALTFGLYGAVHKHIGGRVDGLTGLTVETIVSTPVGVVQGVVLAVTVGLTATSHGTGIFLLVLLSGVVTAVPLIFFGEASSRLPLAYIGFMQFLTPVIAFLYGYFIAGEPMEPTRWVGFTAVWVALTVLVADMVLQMRRPPTGTLPSA